MSALPIEHWTTKESEYTPFVPYFHQVANLVEDYRLSELAELWFELDRGHLTGEVEGNRYLEEIDQEEDDYILFEVEAKDGLDTEAELVLYYVH